MKYRSKAKELYNSTEMIIEELKKFPLPDIQGWREKKLWTQAVNRCFKKHEEQLKGLM